jgi:hypothetical protein
MEYLDDEMDDLFRKAGEHYPLKTSDSDWDAVLGRLQPAGNTPPAEGDIPEKRNHNRRLFWLLLLLPLGLFSIIYFPGGSGNNADRAQAKTPVLNKSADTKADAGSPMAEKERVASTLPEQDYGLSREALPDEPKTISLLPGSSVANQADQVKVTGKQQRSRMVKPPLKSATAGQSSNTIMNNNSAPETEYSTGAPGSGVDKNPDEAATRSPSKGSLEQKISSAPGQTDRSGKTGEAASITDSADHLNKNHSDKASKRDLVSKEKGIYLSILAGPDLSTVKFQQVKRTGYSIGLLAGYRFNRHISIETGLFWDKKQYYSEGEYFNTSKTDIPGTVKIKDLEGNCNMFEIPVSFRYDFAFGRKGRFFSTAGLNSYIMKKENYDYTTEDYPGWSRKVTYNNSSNNLFSILQLSGGYEYGLGKTIRMRVEPYLNIPLKGVGIGSMPLSSAGIHLGITIPFR